MEMTIEQLAAHWLAVKATEKAAQQERVEVEAALIAALGGAKEEGATTKEAGIYKVTITGKLTYKADIPQLIQLASQLPEALRPLKTTTTLDEAGAKYLRHNEPNFWKLIAPAVTISPAKTALSIKEP